MNIFGWLSTGRAFARPVRSGASPSGARPANSGALHQSHAYDTKSQVRPARASIAHILPLMRSGGLSAFPVGMAGTATRATSPANYVAMVRNAYLTNAVAQRACRLVAEALSGAPFAYISTVP